MPGVSDTRAEHGAAFDVQPVPPRMQAAGGRLRSAVALNQHNAEALDLAAHCAFRLGDRRLRTCAAGLIVWRNWPGARRRRIQPRGTSSSSALAAVTGSRRSTGTTTATPCGTSGWKRVHSACRARGMVNRRLNCAPANWRCCWIAIRRPPVDGNWPGRASPGVRRP